MRDKHFIYVVLFTALSVLFVTSCANKGQGPQGGPKDTIPPSVVKSFPSNMALNVQKNKIQIVFDENVNVKDVSNKVIISPPQQNVPSIQSYGKAINIVLNDSLKENTTYSINFGDAIVDNNEGNILKNYIFAFSTGNTIDTLQMSGTVINAENLNPKKGIIVGIYDDFSDSSFLKKPFLRISKTDENGQFIIPNIKAGKYIIRALDDVNHDNTYVPGEDLAFNDSVYTPTAQVIEVQDTVWKDSINIDTIKTVKKIRYSPEKIVLKFFSENVGKRQLIKKAERVDARHFTLIFNAPLAELPEINPLNGAWMEKPLIEKNETQDTLTYWLTDKDFIRKDSINLQVKYQNVDSLNRPVFTTDTLDLYVKRAKKANPNNNDEEKQEYLGIKTNIVRSYDVYKPIIINFDQPVALLDKSTIRLSQMKDTVPVKLDFDIVKEDSIGLKYKIDKHWSDETTYLLEIDSGTVQSIYGVYNNKYKADFTTKSVEDYSTLKLLLANFDSTVVFQVITPNDVVVKTLPAKKNGTSFEYLEPGDYYIKLFIDKNRNGKWDTGNYFKNLQPEQVFYYPKKLTLIKNWEIEETVDYSKIPLLQQKPKELIKEDKKASKN